MLPPGRMHESPKSEYEIWALGIARAVMADPEYTPELEELPKGNGGWRGSDPREFAASRNRFRSLAQTNASDWMPVKVSPLVLPQFETPLTLSLSKYDGAHRIALAHATGTPAIPVWYPPTTFRPVSKRVYQTLVVPDGIIAGERPPDRWPLLPTEYLKDKRIIDIACNSGQHGILPCVVNGSTSTFTGFEIDIDAVADGNAVAKAWGVQDRAKLVVRDVNATANGPWPQADTICFFSACKPVTFDTFMAAVRGSGAKLCLFESHNLHDDPDAARILALPWKWKWLGNTATVTGYAHVRRVWAGVIPEEAA